MNVQCFVDGPEKLFQVDVLDFDIVPTTHVSYIYNSSLFWILSNDSKWQVVFPNVHVVSISTLYWDTSFGNFTIFMWRHLEKVFIMFDTVYMWQADKLKTGTTQCNTNRPASPSSSPSLPPLPPSHTLSQCLCHWISYPIVLFRSIFAMYMLVQQISLQKQNSDKFSFSSNTHTHTQCTTWASQSIASNDVNEFRLSSSSYVYCWLNFLVNSARSAGLPILFFAAHVFLAFWMP